MHIAAITIFPELLQHFFDTALIAKAISSQQLQVTLQNPRAFTHDKHQSIDDQPYGGGSGMVMKAPPLIDAMEAVDRKERSHRILLSAQGKVFDQEDARRLSKLPRLCFVCGRYEGIDERVSEFVDEELSLGDFVLMGGEVAAMAMVESIVRLIPGVLGNPESVVQESHAEGMLEGPQYTRPPEFRGLKVPDVLLGGDHAAIARWRDTQAQERTLQRRPDLVATTAKAKKDP